MITKEIIGTVYLEMNTILPDADYVEQFENDFYEYCESDYVEDIKSVSGRKAYDFGKYIACEAFDDYFTFYEYATSWFPWLQYYFKKEVSLPEDTTDVDEEIAFIHWFSKYKHWIKYQIGIHTCARAYKTTNACEKAKNAFVDYYHGRLLLEGYDYDLDRLLNSSSPKELV